MEPSEPAPSSNANAPISPKLGSRWPITDLIDDLRDLNVIELDNVQQFVQQIRAARGDRPSPELVSQIVATVGRLYLTYAYRVPISLVRAGLASVPRALLDQALFDAEKRDFLRIEPVKLPAPFVEVGAGIPHERGLLYWIVPFFPQ